MRQTRQMDKIRIFGGTRNQADQFMRDLMLNPDEYIAGFDVRDLRGMRNGAVIFVGGYSTRQDLLELMDEIHIRDIRILAKISDW